MEAKSRCGAAISFWPTESRSRFAQMRIERQSLFRDSKKKY
jgi:hypothetical protein